jgi:hypothetical protein
LSRARVDQVVGLLAIPVAFVVTSPALLLSLPTVIRNLKLEARTVSPGADGLSAFGNFTCHLGNALPAAVGLGLLAIAAAGVIVVARRQRREAAVLAAYALGYLVAASLSPLHWDRYVIPLIPGVAILAGSALATVGHLIGRAVDERQAGPPKARPTGSIAARRGRLVGVALAVAVAILVLWPSAQAVVAQGRLRWLPSTRVVASDWANATLPPGTSVCAEMYTMYASGTDLVLYRVFALADQTISDYQARGCRYLMSSSAMTSRFVDAGRYPREASFYASLAATDPLVETFSPSADRGGPEIRVYALSP